MTQDQQDYLDQFANRTLSPDHFDHRGHLYMAWLHLITFSFDEATEKVCDGIRDLAIQFEARDKYNRTLSQALMILMAARLTDETKQDFELYLKDNDDLVKDAYGVLLQYYSPMHLTSETAKLTWVEPDLKVLP